MKTPAPKLIFLKTSKPKSLFLDRDWKGSVEMQS